MTNQHLTGEEMMNEEWPESAQWQAERERRERRERELRLYRVLWCTANHRPGVS